MKPAAGIGARQPVQRKIYDTAIVAGFGSDCK